MTLVRARRTTGRPDQAGILRGADPFQRGEVIEGRGRDRRRGDIEHVQRLGDRERCLPHPVGALDSSRAMISASIRVHRNSSGFHRWGFAVTRSWGARWRIAASLSRPSPAVRSAAQCSCRVAAELVVVQRPERHRRQRQYQRLPPQRGAWARRRRRRGSSARRQPAAA
jgi:hypothetical protein